VTRARRQIENESDENDSIEKDSEEKAARSADA
jgi:hypothetical protein